MSQPPGLPSEVGYWKEVDEWCLGENDRYGTCSFVGVANLHVAVTAHDSEAQVMSDGEIEFADGLITGFDPLNRLTDRGADCTKILDYWRDVGWPGDSTMRATAWRQVDEIEIPAAIYHCCGLYVWMMLPRLGTDDYDFSDNALLAGTPGEAAHCVYMAGYSASVDSFHLVSWQQIYTVSRRWWQVYGRQAFAVLHPAWTPPAGSAFVV